MPVNAEHPVVVPAKPETVYDKLWVSHSVTQSPDFGRCSLRALLRPYRVQNDLYEFAPSGRILYTHDNLFTLHETHPEQETAIFGALAEMGIAVPEGVPAHLYVMEIVARSWGAAAQVQSQGVPGTWGTSSSSSGGSSSSSGGE